MKHGLRSVLLPIALAIGLSCLLFKADSYGKGINTVEHLYDDVEDAMVLKPEIYQTGKGTVMPVFPVPRDNSVGTNNFHQNAITVFSFTGEKVETNNYFRQGVSSLFGTGQYLPVISPDMIGFGQMRRFLLFDFKNMKHEQYGIAFSIDETIEKIGISDANRRRFIFEIKEYDRHSEDPDDCTFSLQLTDLRGGKVNLVNKINIGDGSTWSTAHNKLFLWYFDEKKMQVYNMDLEPSGHVLGDFINSNKDKLDFSRMVPHPSLPFAILLGGKKGASYISWGEGRVKGPLRLLDTVSVFSFSPDGKWVSFQKEDFKRREKLTYIMPVSDKYPHYLGSPILLGRYFNEKYFAWTTKPISFVGSGLHYIYRWELTNEAHPESDRPTFHDYIVERDLERLAREKE